MYKICRFVMTMYSQYITELKGIWFNKIMHIYIDKKAQPLQKQPDKTLRKVILKLFRQFQTSESIPSPIIKKAISPKSFSTLHSMARWRQAIATLERPLCSHGDSADRVPHTLSLLLAFIYQLLQWTASWRSTRTIIDEIHDKISNQKYYSSS